MDKLKLRVFLLSTRGVGVLSESVSFYSLIFEFGLDSIAPEPRLFFTASSDLDFFKGVVAECVHDLYILFRGKRAAGPNMSYRKRS